MPSDPNTIESYSKHAESYDKHVSDPTDSIFHSSYEKPAIQAELPNLEGLDVISIGCGSGLDANWLKENGAASVVGVDLSTGLIDIAKTKFPDLDFHVGDMESLNFDDNSFDIAYSSLAIHYVDDWTQSLKEARRILKDSGQYFFSCGHPIDSAMEYTEKNQMREVKLGTTIDDSTGERTTYGDYLAADEGGTKTIKGKLGEIEITMYHHTVGKMIEQIVASGFTIERLIEPLPTATFEEAHAGKYEQLRKIPAFMIWVLKK